MNESISCSVHAPGENENIGFSVEKTLIFADSLVDLVCVVIGCGSVFGGGPEKEICDKFKYVKHFY